MNTPRPACGRSLRWRAMMLNDTAVTDIVTGFIKCLREALAESAAAA